MGGSSPLGSSFFVFSLCEKKLTKTAAYETTGEAGVGAASRQSSSFCSILPVTRPQSLWNLK